MDLKNQFMSIFQHTPERLYYSPGRVNLIGEHIDYNGGLVFPAAISIGTYAAIGMRQDDSYCFYSTNFNEQGVVTVSLSDLAHDVEHGWVNYAKGIMKWLNDYGYVLTHGLNILVEGNLPPASGLSSSASLEVLIAFILNDVFEFKLSLEQIALIGQSVENNYMGLHCGIMDQLIIAKGVSGKALLMNTSTLETTPVNATFTGYTWVIMNTNYQRKNTDSKYNERVFECQSALKAIQTVMNVQNLCEIKPIELDSLVSVVSSDRLFKRLRHVVTEQNRVEQAAVYMASQNAVAFGELLNQSHDSLKADYEVTGPHLDALVAGARLAGAIGARVTGAGFGGCAIALVPNTQLETFENLVSNYYQSKTQLTPGFYPVHFMNGVIRIE